MDAGLPRCCFCLSKYHQSLHAGNTTPHTARHKVTQNILSGDHFRPGMSDPRPPGLQSNRLVRWTTLAPGFPLTLVKAFFCLEGHRTRLAVEDPCLRLF